ncbi:hypothetical protein [Oscillatoria salina]|uniref:hypothetical protein n=1 Tax=Oscillatoria salina TaxID=331517 RepID=UPI0013BDDE97|nr:hypothetical protein [Oscillatoria salina]MBZ8180508.1 hypothetical protein [Oscillatoria salina IIICB1]NET88951.1 hypothetical protein [Kamptonema sp. SIO1D9]
MIQSIGKNLALLATKGIIMGTTVSAVVLLTGEGVVPTNAASFRLGFSFPCVEEVFGDVGNLLDDSFNPGDNSLGGDYIADARSVPESGYNLAMIGFGAIGAMLLWQRQRRSNQETE